MTPTSCNRTLGFRRVVARSKIPADNKIYFSRFNSVTGGRRDEESARGISYSEVESGEVVVKEELSRHDEEREIMEEPS
jgi:hypothetical protein